MNSEQKKSMILKLLNVFVRPKFPEIWEIRIDDSGVILEIQILVEGTDYEQEMEIEDEVMNIIRYTGEKFTYGIRFFVELWDED